jgi:hypothetical protein
MLGFGDEALYRTRNYPIREARAVHSVPRPDLHG